MQRYYLETQTITLLKFPVLSVMTIHSILAVPSGKRRRCLLPNTVRASVFKKEKRSQEQLMSARVIVPLLQDLSISFSILASNSFFYAIYSAQENKKGDEIL